MGGGGVCDRDVGGGGVGGGDVEVRGWCMGVTVYSLTPGMTTEARDTACGRLSRPHDAGGDTHWSLRGRGRWVVGTHAHGLPSFLG